MGKLLTHPADYQIIVQNRTNQSPNTAFETAFLCRFHKLIETTNAQLSKQFNMQYSRTKSAWGLMSRVVSKLTAHILAIYLNALANRPLLDSKPIIF